MLITAITKFTTIDFPGKLACIIFTGGCNLRCAFCHNPEFVLPEKLEEVKHSAIPFETVMNFLKARKGMLEGVVICGGEPTVQADLIERMREIRLLGYAIKLDTNGLLSRHRVEHQKLQTDGSVEQRHLGDPQDDEHVPQL